MNWKVFMAYAIAIILWASAFPAIRAGLESYAPLHLSLLRLFIGSMGLLVFSIITKMKLPERRDVPVILLLGFLGFSVYHTFLGIGELTVDAGAASLIVSTTPIISALLATVFLKEYFSKFGWFGSVIAFFGVAFITVGSGGEWSFERGTFMILIAAFGESFYFVFQSSYLQKYGFLPFTTYTIWAGTLFMFIFSPGIIGAVKSASLESTITVIYLGLLPTVIPYFAIAYATFKQRASEVTNSLYLTPVIAIFISWLWLGEVPTVPSIVGGVITLIGVSFTNLSSKEKKGPESYTQEGNIVS